MENLLGSLSHPHYSARLQLLRALEVAGRLEEALSLAEQMVGQGGQWQREGATNWVDEYCWLLSLAGRGEEALTRVDQYLSGAFGDLTDANRLLLADRACWPVLGVGTKPSMTPSNGFRASRIATRRFL